MRILSQITRFFKATSVTVPKTVTGAKKMVKYVAKTPGAVLEKRKIANEENPFLELIYKMYEQDWVSRDIVTRIVLGGEKQRYYRYVGQEELEKLLSGKRVTSSRPCHNGVRTDVTSDPLYNRIPIEGKYRLSFKEKSEFSPYPLDKTKKSRIVEHDLKNSEYYLCGGYDISDIEKIEQYIGNNEFRLLDLLG